MKKLSQRLGILLLICAVSSWAMASKDKNLSPKEQVDEAIAQMSAYICIAKIKATLKLSDREFEITRMLFPLAKEAKDDVKEALSPCYPQTHALLTKCFDERIQNAKDDVAYFCGDKANREITIEDGHFYLEKTLHASPLQKEFAQLYEGCLPRDLDLLPKNDKAKRREQCSQKVLTKMLPQIELLKKEKLCQTTNECVDLIAEIISRYHKKTR